MEGHHFLSLSKHNFHVPLMFCVLVTTHVIIRSCRCRPTLRLSLPPHSLRSLSLPSRSFRKFLLCCVESQKSTNQKKFTSPHFTIFDFRRVVIPPPDPHSHRVFAARRECVRCWSSLINSIINNSLFFGCRFETSVSAHRAPLAQKTAKSRRFWKYHIL